jgi:poly-gamma-glutamate synthesis protein (capsule biosynthesis protein)
MEISAKKNSISSYIKRKYVVQKKAYLIQTAKKIPAVVFILFLALMISVASLLTGCLNIFTGASAGSTSAGVTAGPDITRESETVIIKPYNINVYIDSLIPVESRIKINSLLIKTGKSYIKTDPAFQGFNEVFEKDIADISFELSLYESNGTAPKKLNGIFYYAPVVSFYSLIEDITWEQFSGIWQGTGNTVRDIEGKEINPELVLSKGMLHLLEGVLGKCRYGNQKVVEENEVKPAILANENAFSVIAFDDIDKHFKVVKINGVSVLDSDVGTGAYPLSAGLAVEFPAAPFNEEFKKAVAQVFDSQSITNRENTEIVSIIMTGVTALTRQVAAKMDANGILYPADKISDILLDADITHISNEVSFVEDCYAAKPNTMVFCSKPEYLGLIKYINADVIELTGNHLNDYGSKWLDYTLDIYDREGIDYYGGGRDLNDAQKPALFNIKGYKFAFVGANSFGPASDWATEDTAGSAPINSLDEASKEQDMKKYEEIVGSLKNQGYNVIFTFQYLETYNYAPTGQQVKDFERMSDAGAVIVSGSQAHQPQGFELRDEGFVNFGLGNLFFGQALGIEVKQGLVAKHIFYKGKHINTILVTTLIEDFSQPVPTEGQERADLLKAVFEGSIR